MHVEKPDQWESPLSKWFNKEIINLIDGEEK